MTKNRKGFTLIELLVVIAIIALLSTLAVVALNNAREKSRDAKRVSDIKQVQTALELYFADVTEYPMVASAQTLGATGALTLSETNGFSDTAAGTTYMGQVPSDPGSNTYVYTSYQSDGTTACDATSEDCADYEIVFTLEGTTGALTGGAATASPTGIEQS